MKRSLPNIVFSVAVVISFIGTASAINCYVCNATDSATPFQCGEWFERFDTPDIEPQDCSGVHGAKYCIKHIGRFEGGIGAKRFCSSKDLGNYCNYVQNKGDRMEYRSCIFTCSTDGCNGSNQINVNKIAVIGSLVTCLVVLIKTVF